MTRPRWFSFRSRNRRMLTQAIRPASVRRCTPTVMPLEDRVTPANVGYYDMGLGQGAATQQAAIIASGNTPVQLFDLTAADLAGIDVIDAQNPSNGGYGAEFVSRLADIQAAVSSGVALVIHDRYVDGAESILPGGATFNIVRDFSDNANIDVLDNTTLVTNGPGGIVTNSTLDGGNSSSHGFAFSGSLPGTSKQILSTGNPTHIVTFAYQYGGGTVIYSSIPLDFYRAGSNNFSNIYAPNVLAYAATNPLGTISVTGTTPAVGSVVGTIPPQYVVNVSEAVDPSSLNASDFQVNGNAATSYAYTPGSLSITFSFASDPVTAQGVQTMHVANGAFASASDGTGVKEFTGTFRYGSTAMTISDKGIAPAGSLIYDGTRGGSIDFAGDRDVFTLLVDPGQDITVQVNGSGSVRPEVRLLAGDTGNNVVGSATAASAGGEAYIQTVAVGGRLADGTPGPQAYRIQVGDANGGTGGYSVRVILNAALEDEAHGGAGNGTRATAQSLEPAFVQLHRSNAADPSGRQPARAAVLGRHDEFTVSQVYSADFESGEQGFVIDNTPPPDNFHVPGLWHLSEGRGTQPGHSANHSLYYGTGEGPDGGGSINIGFQVTPTTGTVTSPSIALPTGGTLLLDFNYVLETRVFPEFVDFADLQVNNGSGWTSLRRFDRVAESSAWRTSDPVDLTAYAGQTVQLRWSFDTVQGPVGRFPEGWYVDDVRIRKFVPIADYYSVNLKAGESVTVAGEALSAGTVTVSLESSAGAVVATGGSGATNVDSVITDYVATANGTYYVRVVGSNTAGTNYSLVVTRNAEFDTEDNSSFATAQAIASEQVAGRRYALGTVTPKGYVASAVSYGFQDISGTGAAVLQGTDDSAVTLSVAQLAGFSFEFYGTTYSSVSFSTNGLITFGGANGSFTNTNLTTSPSQASIAVLWDDLETFSNSGAVLWQVLGTGGSQQLVIQWNQVGYYAFNPGTITFQAVLSEADGSIRFNYLDLDGGAFQNEGASATVGIKAAGVQGPDRTLLAFNNGPNAYVGSGKSTQISRAVDPDYYVISADDNAMLQIETATPAGGAGAFNNGFDPIIRLYDAGHNLVASNDNGASDGRNASLSYKVAKGKGGNYFIEVNASPAAAVPSSGEYILSVKGAATYRAGSPLLASSSVPGPASTEVLTGAAANALFGAALQRWQQAGFDTSSARGIDVRITNLGGRTLGVAAGNTIWLDDNAAGWGWFVDRTPGDDFEFLVPGNQGEQNRTDLLTVLGHEIGHVLGFEHEESGVMVDTLPAGMRRNPGSSTNWSDLANIDWLSAAAQLETLNSRKQR